MGTKIEITPRRNALKKLALSVAGLLGIGVSANAGEKITVTPQKSSFDKSYEKSLHVVEAIEVSILMIKAGRITAFHSSGITTVQYKINSGTYATAVYPVSYAANDVVWFTFSYSDLDNLSGNIVITGNDN